MENDGKPVVETERDEFADAFKDITSGLKEPGASDAKTSEQKAADDKAAADAAAAAAAAKTPEQKAADDKAAADAAAAAAVAKTPEQKAADDKATADAAAAAAVAKTPEQKAADDKAAADAAAAAAAAKTPPSNVEAQLAEAQRRISELEAARTAAPAAAATPEPALYNDEEKAFLEQYATNWEVVRRGEELVRRAEYPQLVRFIYDQIDKKYGHLLQYVEERVPVEHYTAIVSLVPDYEKVRDAAVAWATSEQQPSIVRAAYKRVVEDGDPAEVAEMIEVWRKATNQAAPAAAAGAPPVAAPAAAANDPARAAAAASLRPVDAQRTVQTQGDDPNDFAGAFEKFAKTA